MITKYEGNRFSVIHYWNSSCELSLGSSRLGQVPRVALFPLTLTIMGLVARNCVECPSICICLAFFSGWDWVYGFWGKTKCSSHHFILIGEWYPCDFLLMFILLLRRSCLGPGLCCLLGPLDLPHHFGSSPLPHFSGIMRWCRLLCVFPTPVLDSSISLRIPVSFYWKIVFRNQDLRAADVPCSMGCPCLDRAKHGCVLIPLLSYPFVWTWDYAYVHSHVSRKESPPLASLLPPSPTVRHGLPPTMRSPVCPVPAYKWSNLGIAYPGFSHEKLELCLSVIPLVGTFWEAMLCICNMARGCCPSLCSILGFPSLLSVLNICMH